MGVLGLRMEFDRHRSVRENLGTYDPARAGPWSRSTWWATSRQLGGGTDKRDLEA